MTKAMTTKPAKKSAAKHSAAKSPVAKKPAPVKKRLAAARPAAATPTKKPATTMRTEPDTAAFIEKRIRDIGGWRSVTMARMRALILQGDPALVEERKWIKPSNPFGVPTYSRSGLVLTLEVYKAAVKVTFAKGAAVPDPTGIFNASLLGTRRAVDVAEGASVDAEAFKALVRAAVAVNLAHKG